MAAPVERFTVEFEDASLVGVETGEGIPVVFLHAGVADKRIWERQIALVADAGFRGLAYDRRGYGETASPDVPFSHLDDLEAVLDARNIRSAVLVGNSMGGALAIDWVIAHPERTIGLVVIGTAVTGMGGGSLDDLPPEIQAMYGALEDAMERRDLETANKIHAHVWLDGPLSPNGRVSGPVRELFLAMNGDAMRHDPMTQEEGEPSAEPSLPDIMAPVLVVVGDRDEPGIVDLAGELSELLPNAFGVVLEDTAHLPSLERPDLFDPLLLEFLHTVTGEG